MSNSRSFTLFTSPSTRETLLDILFVKMTGFVMYILSFPLAALYLAWAFLSDKTLVSSGITYYPNKAFVTFLPAYLMLLVFVIVLAYAGINMLTSPKHDSLSILCDAYSKYREDFETSTISLPDDEKNDHLRVLFADMFVFNNPYKIPSVNRSVTEIYDVDVGTINRHIFQMRDNGNNDSTPNK